MDTQALTPVQALLAHELHVVPEWTDVRLASRGPRRKFKGPFLSGFLTDEERAKLVDLRSRLEHYFAQHYRALGPATASQFTFRPHPTGPEPLHYDKEEGLVVTAFVNVSEEPRVWRVGRPRAQPGPPYEVRDDTGTRLMHFMPGTLWVFRAECLAHQIVYGTCCVQFNQHMGMAPGGSGGLG